MWLNSRSGPGQNRSSSARSWLIDPGARLDEILPRAGQRPDRLRLIGSRARAPGSGDDRCARAHRARTRQTDPTSRARPGTGHAPPPPCSGVAPTPAAPRQAAAPRAARPAARSRPAPLPNAPACGTARSARSRRAHRSPRAPPCPSPRPRARRASPPPSRSRHTGSPSPPSTDRVTFTAPRPGGTVAGAHRQGPRKLGLRPVAACGTSPPSGRAGLWQALH